MATPPSTQNLSSYAAADHDEQKFLDHEEKVKYDVGQILANLISVLPRERGWISEQMYLYQGFWFSARVLKGLLALQQRFRAQPTDILLASYPKSGTTWLKALLFTITNPTFLISQYADQNPLLKANPHELVPYLDAYATDNPLNPRPSPSGSPILHTHIPYSSLPESSKSSNCRIVYVYRDPKDVLVSVWHFVNKLKPVEARIPLEEAFDRFSKGVSPCGPYWEHVLGYWKASTERPKRIFFIRYEDLKKDPCLHTRRLAEFLGNPFADDEEGESLVSKVVEFCSFENLSNLEVNRTGSISRRSEFGSQVIENNSYFRRGQVGDSKNYLKKEMMAHLDQVTEEKFKEFVGIFFLGHWLVLNI